MLVAGAGYRYAIVDDTADAIGGPAVCWYLSR